MINGLSHSIGENIEDYLVDIGPYIVTALKNPEDETTQRFACGIVSDIASNIALRASNYIDTFMEALNYILNDSKISALNKIPAI